jgi:predicted glycosyltransferase
MVLSATLEREASAPDHDVPTPSESDSGVRVLFDIGHPAQVHLFRNALETLQRGGHETFVASRVKEVTVELLDAYGIDHAPLTTRGESFPGLMWELLLREKRLLSVARRFEPDVIVSRLSPAAAHVSTVVGCRNVVVSDTHIDSRLMRLLNYRMTLPFVDTVCAPESFELPVSAAKRRSLDFQELAYLHPQYFEPEPFALSMYGIDPTEPYFLIRLAGWDAYHDVGHRGLSPESVRELVSLLSEHGTVYLSSEGALPPDLVDHALPTPPESIHDVLYYADLYVGDSGTMSTEAALLGTPAIRTNTMVGDDDENVFHELEDRYGLLSSFADEARAIEAVKRLVEAGIDKAEWHRKRDRLIEEQPNVTERIVETILETTTNP